MWLHSRQPTASEVCFHSSQSPLWAPSAPLRGPIQGHSTWFNIGGKSETISVDRLKPVHVDLEQPVQLALPRPCERPPKTPYRTHFSIQIPTLTHSHSTLILYAGLGLHDDTSQFWEEWCSGAAYISRRRTSLW